MALTDKQTQFVVEYLKDFNATQAAIRAGYSEKTAYSIGQENLKKPDISQAIKESLSSQGATVERVVGELLKVAFSDINDYIDIDELTGSTKVKALSKMEPGATRAIETIEEDRIIKESPNGDQVTVHNKFKFKLHNKLKALEMLLGHLKAPVDDEEKDSESGGFVGLPGINADSL